MELCPMDTFDSTHGIVLTLVQTDWRNLSRWMYVFIVRVHGRLLNALVHVYERVRWLRMTILNDCVPIQFNLFCGMHVRSCARPSAGMVNLHSNDLVP